MVSRRAIPPAAADWSCIQQDDADARAAGIASLVPYVATSDLFLIPVEHASLEGVAAVDPQSIPNYGERAWCRLECAIFSLWAEMSQPAAAAKKVKVRMWAAAADGSLRRFGAARYHAFDKRDLPSGGARLRRPPGGYRLTACNGVVTQRDGELTGANPGRVIDGGARRPG